MTRSASLGLVAFALAACQPDHGAGADLGPDPLVACTTTLPRCTIAWTGASTGSLPCGTRVVQPSGVFGLQVSGPPGGGYVGFPNALGAFTFLAPPAVGTYRGADLPDGGAVAVNGSGTLHWQATADPSTAPATYVGALTLEIVVAADPGNVTTGWHGRFAATLDPTSSGSAMGSVSVCASF